MSSGLATIRGRRSHYSHSKSAFTMAQKYEDRSAASLNGAVDPELAPPCLFCRGAPSQGTPW